MTTRTWDDVSEDARLARVDARKARDHSLETHEGVGRLATEVASLRRQTNEGLSNVQSSIDGLRLDVRELGAMRPKLDSISEIDLTDLSEAQKREAKRRRFWRQVARLSARCGKAAALAAAGALGLALAYAAAHLLHLPLPPVHP